MAPDGGAQRGVRRGLLIDWGGVLTTNLFASFHAYCLQAEIDPTRCWVASAATPPRASC